MKRKRVWTRSRRHRIKGGHKKLQSTERRLCASMCNMASEGRESVVSVYAKYMILCSVLSVWHGSIWRSCCGRSDWGRTTRAGTHIYSTTTVRFNMDAVSLSDSGLLQNHVVNMLIGACNWTKKCFVLFVSTVFLMGNLNWRCRGLSGESMLRHITTSSQVSEPR
jgi:hypothetical protein